MVRYETTELVGGPLDGDRVAVPRGTDFFLIPKQIDRAWAPAPETASPQITVGTYRRSLGVFEWMGWDDD